MEYKVYILRSSMDLRPSYVGITSGSLKSRLNKHLHDIKRPKCKNLHKKNWLLKHKNDIIIEQIDVAKDINELKMKEIYYIKKFKDDGIYLFNATSGGDGTYGFKHSEESKNKMKGVNNHRFGKQNILNKEMFGKKVESSLDGINWMLHSSIHDAERMTSVCYRTISNICKGNYVSNQSGYLFRYNLCEAIPHRDRKKNDQSIRKIEIEAFINNEWVTFKSAGDASDKLGLIRSKIVSVCNHKRNHTGGIVFRYKVKNEDIE